MARTHRGPRYFKSKGGYFVNMNGKRYALAMGRLCEDCQELEEQGMIPGCKPCQEIRYQADRRYAELCHMAEVETEGDKAILYGVIEKYLEAMKGKNSDHRFYNQVLILQPFNDSFGKLRVCELKAFHVVEWLKKWQQPRKVKQPKGGERVVQWNEGSVRMALQTIQAMFNWAIKRGYITRQPVPIAAIKEELLDGWTGGSRSKETLITADVHKRILAYAEQRFNSLQYWASKASYCLCVHRKTFHLAYGKQAEPEVIAKAKSRLEELRQNGEVYDEFGLLVRLLHHTGARPGEIYNAEAKHWKDEDEKHGAFVYPQVNKNKNRDEYSHKNAKYKDRFVRISNPTLLMVVRKLVKQHPTGKVFRNHLGHPWTDGAVCDRFARMREVLALPVTVIPYSYRHTSITNMLLKGVPDYHVAELHGTSIGMIRKHYGHLDGHQTALDDIWVKAKCEEE